MYCYLREDLLGLGSQADYYLECCCPPAMFSVGQGKKLHVQKPVSRSTVCTLICYHYIKLLFEIAASRRLIGMVQFLRTGQTAQAKGMD